MQFLVFILIYPLIWLLSILPLRVLHFMSDCFYYLLYYVIRYRKKTVIGNLTLAFPEKSDEEIKIISKKFYSHFIDIIIEMIKSFTISKKEIAKRYKAVNIDILHQLETQQKSAIFLGAHYANWEWVFAINLLIKFNGYAVYKKLKNSFFDKKIRQSRGRFNTTLVPTKEIFSLIEENHDKHKISLYGFLGDQSPKINKTHYWSDFLGIKVPIHTGVELLSKKHNLPVVFFKTKRIKRGYYESTIKLLTDKPKDFENYQITELFLREVEAQIREAPEFYLWTHKRFKHRDKAPD